LVDVCGADRCREYLAHKLALLKRAFYCGIVNLTSSGAIEASSLVSSESGSMSVKSENSNPGATEQPTRTVSDMGSAACQIPAGMTWQKELLSDDRVMHSGGVLDYSAQIN